MALINSVGFRVVGDLPIPFLYQGLMPISGTSDGVNCDGSGTYPVEYNGIVNYTDQFDITWVKNQGLAGEESLPAGTATISGGTQIVYTAPAWNVATVVGDTLRLLIGALSTYTDSDGNPIAKQGLLARNCLDPVIGATNFLVEGVGEKSAVLTWEEPVYIAGLTSYDIYRDDVLIASLPLGTSRFSDPDLANNTSYIYTIKTLLIATKVISSEDVVATTLKLFINGFLTSAYLSNDLKLDPNFNRNLFAPLNKSSAQFNSTRVSQ